MLFCVVEERLLAISDSRLTRKRLPGSSWSPRVLGWWPRQVLRTTLPTSQAGSSLFQKCGDESASLSCHTPQMPSLGPSLENLKVTAQGRSGLPRDPQDHTPSPPEDAMSHRPGSFRGSTLVSPLALY